MPAAAQAHRCRLNPAQIVLAPGPVPGLAAESGTTLLSFRNTPMEGRPHRSHPHFRFLGGMKPVRRAKPARRSSRLKMQSLRSEVSPAAERVPNRKALRASRPVDPSYLVALEGLRRLLPEPTPSPRLWASVRARPRSDTITLTRLSGDPRQKRTFLSGRKADISIWR